MSPTETLIARHPLQRRKILKKTIATFILPGGLVGPFIIIVLGSFAALMLGVSLFVYAIFLAGLIVAVACAAYYYQTLYFNNYFYDLTPDGLVISKGVLGRWAITLPPNKVQDVYLDQDLLDRLFGLYDLHLSSATEVSAREAHIDGVSAQDAQALRNLFLQWLSGKEAGPSPLGAPNASQTGKSIPISQNGTLVALGSALLGAALFFLFFFPYGLLLAPFILIFAYLDFTARRYELRADGVFIRTGFFTPKESIFLYRNIQDVEDVQGLLDRLFDLHTLAVKTMTGESAVVSHLPFLSSEESARAREAIIEASRQATVPQSSKPAMASGVSARAASLPAVTKPPAPALASPFKLGFMRAALYQGAWTIGQALIVGISLSAAVILIVLFGADASLLGFAGFAGVGLGVVAVGVAIFGLMGAAINNVAYSYEVGADAVTVSIKFISSTVRRIPFAKAQDIEKRVSFSDSFAGLAGIALESGAKEMVREQQVASVTQANETIPALLDGDAERLKLLFAQRMGISLAGIGDNPLSARLPLDSRKPLKKTAGWALWLAFPLLAVAGVAALVGFPVGYGVLAAAIIASGATLAVKYWYEREYLKKYFYDSNDGVLVIRKGVFGSRELAIPFEKIQEVFIDRDALDLIFGLYDVYVSTATSRSILNAHLDGLDQASAQTAAKLITGRIAALK